MDERGVRPYTGQIWWLFMLRGVLAALLGACALIWPTLTVGVLVLIVGVYLIADGVTGLVVAWRAPAHSVRLLQPAVGLAVGLLLVLWPSQSARTLFVVLGAGAVFVGISYVVGARRLGIGTMDRRLITTVGVVASLLGVILLVWPGAGVVSVSWIIAVTALLMAVVQIFLGVRLKQLGVRIEATPPGDPKT